MKKANTLINILTGALLILVIIKQAPVIFENFKNQQRLIPTKKVLLVSSDGNDGLISYPQKKKRTLAIFWSTSCAPCKLEMKRLKSSVESGKISRDAIFAINPFESVSQIRKFIKKNPHPFRFISDHEISSELSIQVTPTSVRFDGEKIESISSGMSLTGILSTEYFLSR